MKHFLLLSLFSLFCCVAIQAQEPETVVIDGVTFSADLKTLIKYPADKKDETYVIPEGTEVVGIESFLDVKSLREIVLPATLKQINDYAFSCCINLRKVIWNSAPTIGNTIFWFTPASFEVSHNNEECVCIDGVLFSKDKKRLLICPPYEIEMEKYIVPEGTEIIGHNSFDGTNISQVILPSSIQYIENNAFRVCRGIPVRAPEYDHYHWFLESLICYSKNPPELVGDPFVEPGNIELGVPYGCHDIYSNATGWKDFKIIYEVNEEGIPRQLEKNTNVFIDNGEINVINERSIITKILVYNEMGSPLSEQIVNANYGHWAIPASFSQKLLLIKVVLGDYVEEVFKLIK